MKALSIVSLATFAFACGGGTTMPPGPVLPTPDVVRNTYGLNAGSCWLYQVGQTFATISIDGPDMNAVEGRSVYVQTYQPASGGLPNKNYFDTEKAGDVRLLRSLERGSDGTITSKRFDGDPTPPLYAHFQFDAMMKNAILVVGQKFTVTTTPMGGSPEMHEWAVISYSEMPVTPSGPQKAYKLQYTRSGNTQAAVYHLVPGFGFAKFQDFSGMPHQVCAARVCDASGTCTGADSCANLQPGPPCTM